MKMVTLGIDCKRPVSDKPCYPDRVWEAPVGGGLSIVTGLTSGSNSSNRIRPVKAP